MGTGSLFQFTYCEKWLIKRKLLIKKKWLNKKEMVNKKIFSFVNFSLVV